MKYIYLIHPISKGNSFHNVHEACRVADRLMKLGYVVMVPGLSVLQDMIFPNDYETYMTQDFAWLEKMDCAIRLKGESSGGDREEVKCKELGVPVFHGEQAFLDYMNQFADEKIRLLTNPPIQTEVDD